MFFFLGIFDNIIYIFSSQYIELPASCIESKLLVRIFNTLSIIIWENFNIFNNEAKMNLNADMVWDSWALSD